MYAAPLETDYRSSTPAVSRGTPTSSDVFAELLRRHAEVSEPAPQPEQEAARPTARPQRDRAPAEDADTVRPADADADADDTAPVAAETDPKHHTEESAAADEGDTAVTPVVEDEPGTPTAEMAAPAEPAADAAVSVQPAAPAPEPVPTPTPTVLLAAVPAPSATPAADTPAKPDSAAPAPAVGAPAPAPANAPIVDPDVSLPPPPAPRAAAPVAADPATTPRPAADAPAQPAENLPPRPLDSAPPRMAAAPAAAAPAGDTQTATAATPSAPASDSMADDAQSDVRVQVQRNADATQAQTQGLAQGLAQGLGKLGTGAEIALAAQAIGDAQRRGPADAGKPEITTKPQPATGIAGNASANAGGNASAQPAATTGNAAAANGGQAATPQRAADTASATFDAALGAATSATDHDGTGLPGTAADTGLRAAGTTTGATAASLRTAALHGSPAEQVAIQVQRAVRDGASRITVQLRPAELGPVEVRLDFAQDGRVSATILADRADTLDMLQRDARTLERSLQDAGLKADSGSLSFDLRDGSRNGSGSQQMAGGNREGTPMPARPERQATADTGSTQPTMASTADGGVDIRV